MSDIPRPCCPGCEPEADQILDHLEIMFCGTHMPGRAGADDGRASFALDAPSEAEQSRALCGFVHRDRPAAMGEGLLSDRPMDAVG
jgi:hypothetical protein